MLYYLLQVSMRTLADCKLGVSIYPILEYDASGGGGVAEVTDKGCAPVHSTMQSAAVAVNIACSRPARLWPIAEIAEDSPSLRPSALCPALPYAAQALNVCHGWALVPN